MAQIDRGTFENFRNSIDPAWIEEALAASGSASLRKRRLPAEQVVWLVLGMALFRDLAIHAVVKVLDLAFPSSSGRGMANSAVSDARGRVGSKPLMWLFNRCSQQWAAQSADQLRWHELAILGLDGSTLRAPDTAENRAHFTAHGGHRGASAYPLVRLVTLMVLRSHLISAARFGPFSKSEQAYAKELWPQVRSHSLVIVDRNFFGAPTLIPLARDCEDRHWLTRAKAKLRWTTIRKLGRVDEIVEMNVSRDARRQDPTLPKTWQMRAIHYQRRGFATSVLLTSMLDSERFPADEIIALYHERWELELGYDEVKTEMLDREEAIRSQGVDGVEQEIWGVLLAYNLVRLEITRVAVEAGVPPIRISFVAAYHYIRHALVVAGFLSPGALPKHLVRMRRDVAAFVLPPRRPKRCYPRAVKIKMSPYPRMRSRVSPAPADAPKAVV